MLCATSAGQPLQQVCTRSLSLQLFKMSNISVAASDPGDMNADNKILGTAGEETVCDWADLTLDSSVAQTILGLIGGLILQFLIILGLMWGHTCSEHCWCAPGHCCHRGEAPPPSHVMEMRRFAARPRQELIRPTHSLSRVADTRSGRRTGGLHKSPSLSQRSASIGDIRRSLVQAGLVEQLTPGVQRPRGVDTAGGAQAECLLQVVAEVEAEGDQVHQCGEGSKRQ